MLLIYAKKITNRLGYTLNLVFGELMGIEYSITTDEDFFVESKDPKLSYCKHKLCDEAFLCCDSLLFDTTIELVDVNYFERNGLPYLFKQYSKDSICDNDVLASVFYLVSRYEEYLPFVRDEHSRFKAEDSLAYKKGFLDKPVVNIWVKELKQKLQATYPNLESKKSFFTYTNTIDVDSAYSYRGKGGLRTCIGLARDLLKGNLALCLKRLSVLIGKRQDPYDTFDYIISILQKYKVNTTFFILFGNYGRYDKNISPYNPKFRLLLKSLCDYAKVGIHPSYESFEESELMSEQIKMLKSLLRKPIHRSRFHYLRFRLPESYRELINNNIEGDYSMGYSNAIGFRAGICNSFNFYDLALDFETKLRIFPFAYMDVALKNGLQLSPDSALDKIMGIVDKVVEADGNLISVWHNESLSEDFGWEGWRSVYERSIEYVSKKKEALFSNK